MPARLTGTEREAEIRRKLTMSLRRDLAAITALPADLAERYQREIADFRTRAERWLSEEAGTIYPDRPTWLVSPPSSSKAGRSKMR